MYNRRYEKVFLMLRQETAGYAIGKRPPWGSCVMELKNGKGKLHLTVQGLKPLPKGSYGVYVMAGAESIFCGELQPDKKDGRCELKWDFAPDAVGNQKKAEDFHTVLILAEEGQGHFSAPLTAFFGERQDWRKDFQPCRKEAPKEEIILQAAEAAATEKPAPIAAREEKKPETNTNEKIAEEQKKSYHGSFQGLLAKFRQELEELEETGILTKAETEHIRTLGQETSTEAKEKIVEQDGERKTVPVKVESQELSFFAKNRELFPFADGTPWKCLSLEELTLLSQIPLRWQKEFFFLLPYRKYHHLILQETKAGVWLGLPDHYDEKDAAEGERFGFREFRSVDGDWGYWMCFLERNG